MLKQKVFAKPEKGVVWCKNFKKWFLEKNLTIPPRKRVLQICEAVRHAKQGSKACKVEIPNPNKKANHKLLYLTVG